MKIFLKIGMLLIVLCITSLPSLLLADDPPMDPFYTEGVQLDAPPINTVTENIDPFSGILTLAQTDIHLPGNGGLDVNITRTYNT